MWVLENKIVLRDCSSHSQLIKLLYQWIIKTVVYMTKLKPSTSYTVAVIKNHISPKPIKNVGLYCSTFNTGFNATTIISIAPCVPASSAWCEKIGMGLFVYEFVSYRSNVVFQVPSDGLFVFALEKEVRSNVLLCQKIL